MSEFDPRNPFPSSPILAGAAVLSVGLLLRRWQPTALELPEPERKGTYQDEGARRAARHARDGVAKIMPRNLTRSVGRSLIAVGASLLLIRALDAVVDDDEALF